MTFFEFLQRCLLWDAAATVTPPEVSRAVIKRLDSLEAAGTEQDAPQAGGPAGGGEAEGDEPENPELLCGARRADGKKFGN